MKLLILKYLFFIFEISKFFSLGDSKFSISLLLMYVVVVVVVVHLRPIKRYKCFWTRLIVVIVVVYVYLYPLLSALVVSCCRRRFLSIRSSSDRFLNRSRSNLSRKVLSLYLFIYFFHFIFSLSFQIILFYCLILSLLIL